MTDRRKAPDNKRGRVSITKDQFPNVDWSINEPRGPEDIYEMTLIDPRRVFVVKSVCLNNEETEVVFVDGCGVASVESIPSLSLDDEVVRYGMTFHRIHVEDGSYDRAVDVYVRSGAWETIDYITLIDELIRVEYEFKERWWRW